jgi:hypothetical protein
MDREELIRDFERAYTPEERLLIQKAIAWMENVSRIQKIDMWQAFELHKKINPYKLYKE